MLRAWYHILPESLKFHFHSSTFTFAIFSSHHDSPFPVVTPPLPHVPRYSTLLPLSSSYSPSSFSSLSSCSLLCSSCRAPSSFYSLSPSLCVCLSLIFACTRYRVALLDFLNLHANRGADESRIIKGPLLHVAEQARATV